MEFIGYAVKRIDTGEWWNKATGWNKKLPTIYSEKRFATCAGKYHLASKQHGFIQVIKIKSITINVEEIK